MNIYLDTVQIMRLAAKLDPDRKYNLPMNIAEEFSKAAADNAVREVVEWVETHRYKARYLEGDVMIPAEEWQELKALVTEKEKE